MCSTRDQVQFHGKARLGDTRETLDDLKDIRAWIRHWREDREYGLTPTRASLSQADRIVERVMKRMGA